MGRFRRNGKQKWRQQKVAIGTIEKIARRVANYEIDKDVENKYSIVQVGHGGTSRVSPLPLLLSTEGMYDAVTALDMNNSYFAPNTVPAQAQQAGQPRPVNTGSGFRLGDQVTVTGIGFKGLLKLPELCAHATVTIKLLKFDAPLGRPPWAYFASLKRTGIRRQQLEYNRAKVMKSITVNLNHRAYSRDVTREIDMYVKCKDKKIRYKKLDDLNSRIGPCVIADFQDEFFMLVAFSDATHPLTGFPSPIPIGQANIFPHLYGRMVCYYQDA